MGLKFSFRAEGGGIRGKCTCISQMLQLPGGGEGRGGRLLESLPDPGAPHPTCTLGVELHPGSRAPASLSVYPHMPSGRGSLGSPQVDFRSEESLGSLPCC